MVTIANCISSQLTDKETNTECVFLQPQGKARMGAAAAQVQGQNSVSDLEMINDHLLKANLKILIIIFLRNPVSS